MKTNRSIVVAVVAGIVATISVYLSLAGTEPAVDVLIAAQDIPARSIVEPDELKVVRLPGNAVHPLALTPDSLNDRMISVVPVFAGEQLISRHVVASADSPVGATLNPGKVAFLVPGGWNMVAGGAIEPGDRVDVILVTDERQAGRTMACTILHHIRVIDIRTDSGQRWADLARGDAPVGLLLEVSPVDAERLALAMRIGQLSLSLSASHATEQRRGTPVTVDQLLYGHQSISPGEGVK